MPDIGGGDSYTEADTMPVETTEKQAAVRGEISPLDTPSTSESVPAEHEARQSASPPPDQRSSRRRLLIGALGALILVALGVFGTPWVLACGAANRVRGTRQSG
jgi:hypothetical protein